MLRSILGTGLLVTVYRVALSVAAPRGDRENSPQTQFFRAERMKIDYNKILKCYIFQFFIKIFLKSF